MAIMLSRVASIETILSIDSLTVEISQVTRVFDEYEEAAAEHTEVCYGNKHLDTWKPPLASIKRPSAGRRWLAGSIATRNSGVLLVAWFVKPARTTVDTANDPVEPII